MTRKVALEKLLVPASEEQLSKEKERSSKEKKDKDKEISEGMGMPITEKEASEFLKFIKHSE